MVYPLPTAIKLLSGATSTGAGEWVRVPREKVFEVSGITTATVLIQYRTHENGDPLTLDTFTADGTSANDQTLYEVRANVTTYVSGTIDVYVTVVSI
jgi:hypothetical protein